MWQADDPVSRLSTRSTLAVVGQYEITDDPDRVDLATVHRFLSRDSYWRRGVREDTVVTSVRMSLTVSAHARSATPSMVGFLRVVTDTVTHAWLDDLFVLAAHRGNGLGGALVEAALQHPAVRSASMQLLLTADAHQLYARYGFSAPSFGSALMARLGH